MSSTAPTRELIPPEMDQHRVAWLSTENGQGWSALTKIRFATDGGKVYSTLRGSSVALQHIESNPQVKVALGKGNRRVRGPEIPGMAFVVPRGETSWVRHLLTRKYWWLRIPWFWSSSNVPIEITLS